MSQKQIRNFCIISHIDHGKSTLADRFLELTASVEKRKMQSQYLDMMDLERERGITIKMQPVRMEYVLNGETHILNLIDTPGHVDFSYEVSRSLAAVEGAVLLVDATKGIQAQTLANLNLARKQNLVIIPVVNKIDLPHAEVEKATKNMANLLGISENEIIKISAKQGINIPQVLEAVIRDIPQAKEDLEKSLRALIFDSKYDSYKGVIAYVRVIDGKLSKNERIFLMRAKVISETKEVGYFKPYLLAQNELHAGEIGYIATGVKEPGKVKVGDTITLEKMSTNNLIQPLDGYQESKPMIFAGIYPENGDDYDLLKDSLARLKLSDAALSFDSRAETALGRGFHCGFLGMLHIEIISERLSREFGLKIRLSSPTVVYEIVNISGKSDFIYSAADWPDASRIHETKEPWAKLEIITPNSYLGPVSKLLDDIKAKHIETSYIGSDSVLLHYEAPLREIIVNFYDKLKSSTQGYASMNYEVLDYRPIKLVKLDILVAGKIEEAFSKITPEAFAHKEGSKIVRRLKEILPSLQFSVPLQAVIQGQIIARETLKPRRKDVTSGLYGGDYSRKRKVLEKQKKGKKALKEKGSVNIPPEAYIKILS